jgi:monoamine oxidase
MVASSAISLFVTLYSLKRREILSSITRNAALCHRIRLAAENIHRIFPGGDSLDQVEASASQVFPADELAGGSAFCYFGPGQKSQYLETMCQTDWENRVFFAGEQTSYSHGWIQGALEAGLRCVQQVYAAATEPIALQ